MKKASFTLFQPQSWIPILGRSALLVLFAWCCLGIQGLSAQTATDEVEHPADNGQFDNVTSYQIETCDGENVLYTDDNTGDGKLYYDNFQNDVDGFVGPALDIVEFCPQDQWHRVNVVFTDAGINSPDRLLAFQGTAEELEAATREAILRSGSFTNYYDLFDPADDQTLSLRDTLLRLIDSTTLIEAYLADDSIAIEGPMPDSAAAIGAPTVEDLRAFILGDDPDDFTNEDIAALLTTDELIAALYSSTPIPVDYNGDGTIDYYFTTDGGYNNMPFVPGLRYDGGFDQSNLPFGGWISAECDPARNASGCLTFVFQRNGDNRKSIGWEAWVTCEDSGIEVTANIPNAKIECDDADGLATVMVPAPTIDADCGNINPLMIFRIKNQLGKTVYELDPTSPTDPNNPGNHNPFYHQHLDDIDFPLVFVGTGGGVGGLPPGGAGAGAGTIGGPGFGPGLYTGEWIMAADTVKRSDLEPFAVSLPGLVCNNDVNIPLGSACAIEIAPDDVLENQCLDNPGLGAFLEYRVTVNLGGNIYTGSGTGLAGGVAGSQNANWPIITRDLLEQAATASGGSADVCAGEAEVTIERRYIPPMVMGAITNDTFSVSCTTTVHFSDETPPIITSAFTRDTVHACNLDNLRSMVEDIKAIDNCDSVDTEILSMNPTTLPECFDTVEVVVTLQASDQCGNTSTAEKTFVVVRPNEFADADDTTVECSDEGLGATHPSNTGWIGYKVGKVTNGVLVPSDTIDLNDSTYECNYVADYDDQRFPSDCGEKIFRIWRVLDWCQDPPAISVVDTQLIEVTDTTPPHFTYDGADTLLSGALVEDLEHFSCTIDLTTKFASNPPAEDNCDPNPTVTLTKVEKAGLVRSSSGEVDSVVIGAVVADATSVGCDTFRLEYVAEDACHEQLVEDTLYRFVIIRDNTAPTAICTDKLHVSVPNEWGARVLATDIDGGSYDQQGCEGDTILVRRDDDPDGWDDHVDIECTDVHTPVKVWLRIIDAKGNIDDCWMYIEAEDKIPPTCEALRDTTGFCDDSHANFLGASTDTDGDGEFDDDEWTPMTAEQMTYYNTNYGNPDCSDNLECGSLTYEQEYQLTEWKCGAYNVKRRYRVRDWTDGNYSNWGRAKYHYSVPTKLVYYIP